MVYALKRGSRGWSTMPVVLSTLSPSKKVLPSAETARRKRSDPKTEPSVLRPM